MFQIIFYTIINLLPLHWNYYVSKTYIKSVDNFKIQCNLKKEVNETSKMKAYLVNKVINIYQQFLPSIINKCIKSNNPKKCVVWLTQFNYNTYITWLSNFSKQQQTIIYQNIFNIIRQWYKNWVLNDNILKKQIKKLLSNKWITIIINKTPNLSTKLFNQKINKKIDITNKNYFNLLKNLITNKSITHFNLKCSKILFNKQQLELSNKVDFYKNQNIANIKKIFKDNKKLVCDNITNICYWISDTINIQNNIKNKYLSWYSNNFTGAIKYIIKNQDLFNQTGVKINYIKLNKERINLTYNLLNKLVSFSGNKLIISNETGAIEKIQEIYKRKYWKDLYILINAIKLNNLERYKLKKKIKRQSKNNKKTMIKVYKSKKNKINKKIKKQDILKKQQKLIEENREAIKKQLEEKSNHSKAGLFLWWTILLIIITWWMFYIWKRKYEI